MTRFQRHARKSAEKKKEKGTLRTPVNPSHRILTARGKKEWRTESGDTDINILLQWIA